jgi:hypothetical protein
VVGSRPTASRPRRDLALDYPFAAGSLVDAAHAPDLYAKYPMYAQGLDWLREFIATANPAINRPGHVCPRVAPALRRNLIWLVTIQTANSSARDAFDKGQHLPGLFWHLFGEQTGRAGSLLAFFPDISAADAPEFIDGGHRLLRKHFVRQGLMLGEFHPSSTVASVRNPAFPVMRSPAPMFAVRALTVHDLMFLDQPGTPASDRMEYLNLYLRHLGDQLPDDVRRGVLARIAETEAAV